MEQEKKSSIKVFSKKRIVLSAVINVTFIVLLFITAGRFTWIEAWIFLSFWTVSVFLMLRVIKNKYPDLLKERMSRADNTKKWDKKITFMYTMMLIAVFAVSALDAGRYRWSSVPFTVKMVAAVLMLIAYFLVFWAMYVNHFFSSVVRIQEDRGHYVISKGPYLCVRHPGYAGIGLICFCIPLFLGSWWALIPGGIGGVLFLLRTALEDKVLMNELPGYKKYAKAIRYRLIPGIW